MLDIAVPPIYISWGERSVGIRSYESPQPFIIIGGDHLKTDSPYHLSVLEIQSILAMELYHIKCKHSRITSNEVWQGFFDKSSATFEGIISLLPFIPKFPQTLLSNLDTFNNIRGVIPKKWMETIYTNDSLQGFFSQSENKHNMSVDPSSILLAYRTLQYNADRVALLATGSLYHTISSFFIGKKSLNAYRTKLSSEGFHAYCLATLPENEIPLQENITLRTAALISFYLSDEYHNLRSKIISSKIATEKPEAVPLLTKEAAYFSSSDAKAPDRNSDAADESSSPPGQQAADENDSSDE